MILNINYLYLFFYFFFIIFVIILLFLISFFAFQKKKIKTIKKKSLYECGFESFGNAKITLNIQFINIALLFIIFDLEILFILPWIISANFLGVLGAFTIYIVLNFFVFGFIYEYLIGALNWNKKNYSKKK